MAVFTAVSLSDLADWMLQFPLGRALNVRGISSGIENSNFFLDTESGTYVLTVFENLDFTQLPFYLQLMRHLAQRGIPVPEPVPNAQGALCTPLHGKPAAIVRKLEGESQLHPEPAHCRAVGGMLARMHLAGRDFPLQQPNLRGFSWWHVTAPKVLPFLSASEQHLLCAELHFQEAFHSATLYRALPEGPIHADLFRNNVMFSGTHLEGFFDFYFAGCDPWLFDVAVTVNDWCIDLESGALDVARVHAFLAAYHAERPFTDEEKTAWQPMLRAAALRFWLSRLYDLHCPRAAELLTPHDPRHFERILRLRAQQPDQTLPELA